MAKKTKTKKQIKNIKSKSLPIKKNNSKKETKKQIVGNGIRGKDGKLFAGVVLNPKGRPKGSANKYSIKDLFHELRKVEKKEKKTLLTKYCERAFHDDDSRVLLHLIDRFLPALKSMELSGEVGVGSISDEKAASIQKELLMHQAMNK